MDVEDRPVVPVPIELFRRADEALTGVRARESRTLIRVRSGVYAPRDGWATLAPWTRYLARVHAYALVQPAAIFCLESAAALIGLPLFGEPRDIHVYQPRAPRNQRHGDVCTHTAQQVKGLRPGAILTTSVAETTVDLLRALPPAFALAVGDAAARDFATPASALRDVADHQSATRGRRRLDWTLPRIDERSESVGESVSRAVLEWSGFPKPELQVWFDAEGARDRVDFFWPRVRVGGESDGYEKYTLASGDPMRALKLEKAREDRLRRQLQGFARWDWADTMRATPLQHKLLHAGVPQRYPINRPLLATLARNLRSL